MTINLLADVSRDLSTMSEDELRTLVQLYGSALAQICLLNNRDTIFVPHMKLPEGALTSSPTPHGIAFTYVHHQQNNDPNRKLN